MADYVDKSAVIDLEKMGFSADQVRRAMSRSGDDVNKALDMLSSGQVPGEDAFDLLASAEKPYASAKDKKAFNPAPTDKNKGGFGVVGTGSTGELVDGRLSRFKEMGFAVGDAESALAACNNDVDAALSMLLGARGATRRARTTS